MTDTPVGKILVVDDEPVNRDILRSILVKEGNEVLEASNGREALDLFVDHDFDIVFLDVMMPEIDGFEVCRKLKGNPFTDSTHIILVSALGKQEDRTTGIAAGADDFISKPYDVEYLTLRARNALRMKHLHDEVQDQYDQLLDLEKSRDGLVQMLFHDMRQPLASMQQQIEKLKQSLGESEELDSLSKSSNRLLGMIGNVLDVSRSERSGMTIHSRDCWVEEVISTVIDDFPASDDQATIRYVPSAVPLPEISCDHDLLGRILENLIGNALKSTPSFGEVFVTTSATDGAVTVSVRDTGLGMTPEVLATIFEKFPQTDNRTELRMASSGLGLAFCKMAVESMGGTIGVESQPGHGSDFWFELPAESTIALVG